jgi:prepilin-type N-terminal cleavage/methylation domain-containing protein
MHSAINHIMIRHSCESRNPGKHWIPGQARNDKKGKTSTVLYRFWNFNSELLVRSKGFTLIEIIIVIIILSIVSAITIKFLVDSLRVYTMTVNQKTLLDEGKLAIERMCRDIRDARSITIPAAGGSGNMIRFQRTHNTAPSQDLANEWIRFQLALQPDGTYTLQKVKNDTGPPTANLASNVRDNVNDFIVRRDAGNEIQLYLKLSLTSGENVTLQTRVYPKNFVRSTTYKNFAQNWLEDRSL